MGRVALIWLLVGCGPSVSTPDVDGTTTATTSTTTSTSTSTTTSTTTTTTTTTTGFETDTDETSSSGESDGGTTDMCSCEGMPIGLDDEVDEGFTPAQVIEGAPFDGVQWIWDGVESAAETTSMSGVEYKGGAVFDEVGGCCGSFLCAPCPEGVTIHEVMVVFSTADGRVAHAFTGSITGPGVLGMRFDSNPVPMASLGGTLSGEALVVDGSPYATKNVSLSLQWEFTEGELVLEHADLYGDDNAVIGHYPPL